MRRKHSGQSAHGSKEASVLDLELLVDSATWLAR
jgi:hypothetical protein